MTIVIKNLHINGGVEVGTPIFTQLFDSHWRDTIIWLKFANHLSTVS